MAQDGFKLPSSSYDELVRILRGYLSAGDDASLDDVSKRSALNRTMISGNNGFLIESGILQRGQKKSLTPIGRRLAQALDHDMDDEIRASWREIVGASEFLDNLVSAVRIRNGMDRESLTSHIAYSAGQKKSPRVMTGARTIVAILQAGRLVEESDGKFVAVAGSPPPASDTSPVHRDLRPASSLRVWTGEAVPVAGKTPEFSVSVRVDVRVDVSPDELEGLAPRIRRLLSELQAEPMDEPSDEEG